jgi:hypothetical protein
MLPTPPSTPDDWRSVLQAHVEGDGQRFDLNTVLPGDVLRVVTRHTVYVFAMTGKREGELRTDRADRPAGSVQIVGCTFGLSSTISPDLLFCGGNLEFRHDAGTLTCTTTAIRAIQHVRRRAS